MKMKYNLFYPTSLELSLKELLRKVLMIEDMISPRKHTLSIRLFKTLQDAGCDYFELVSILTGAGQFTDEELETLIASSPELVAQLKITPRNIRECISRWTASKYHSASIDKVVEEIKRRLTENIPCVTVFNSNLNPKNKHAINDQYILLISKEHSIILDINRKTATGFIHI